MAGYCTCVQIFPGMDESNSISSSYTVTYAAYKVHTSIPCSQKRDKQHGLDT